MISKILMKLGIGDGSLNSAADTRRKHARFPALNAAEIVINDQPHSLVDWSMGGVAFAANSNDSFDAGAEINFTLLFRLTNDIIAVAQSGRVIRKNDTACAVQFTKATPEAKRGLQRVLDEHNNLRFLQSQVA